MTKITIPESVSAIGNYVFSECKSLEKVDIKSKLMGNFMLISCTKLISLTISSKCKTFGQNMLTYCDSLFSINYQGTVSQWKDIAKQVNWICSGENNWNGHLIKIQCTDGYFLYDSTNHAWSEVKI